VNDAFGHVVAGRGLSGEKDDSREALLASAREHVQMYGVKDREELPFVLVNPFDLRVEERLRRHPNPGRRFDERREPLLVCVLCVAEGAADR
jgi:hypothetical protein